MGKVWMTGKGPGRNRIYDRQQGNSRKWHPLAGEPLTDRLRARLRAQSGYRWPVVLLIVLLQSGPTPRAQDSGINPATLRSGSLLVRMQSGYQVATRINTDINATVSGMVARVAVSQAFRNSGDEWVEGVYVFPLPDGAAVDRLRMFVGDRYIEGDIREKEEARKEYEAARNAGRKSSLVEQQRANLFTTSIANIAPGETIRIEVEYLESVHYEDESFSLRFPVAVTPRYMPGTPLPDRQGSGWSDDTDRVQDASLITPPLVSRSSEHQLTFRASVNAGTPLQLIASRYHPVRIEQRENIYTVELSANEQMDHDIELTWRPIPSREPRALIFEETLDSQPHLLLMMLPPDQSLAAVNEVPRELVFVIDTSGSMHGTSIDQAIRALTLALDGLRPADRFNVIQFNSVTDSLFPGAVSATAEHLGIAKRYVTALEANGGTEMRPALQQSLMWPIDDDYLRQVIFITDGSVGNEQELFNLIDGAIGTSRLFTVGIGSAPNGWFMRKAAEAGRGSFTTISALHEVEEKMGRLFRKLRRPELTNVTVQWPTGQAPLSYPLTVPDLYAGEPVLIKARLSNELLPGDVIRIGGDSVLGPWGRELSVDRQQSGSGVAALWARARIEHLLDQASRGADAAEIRGAVVATAMEHHLVSKFTSLVAIDKTPVRPNGAALQNEQVPNLLPYGQSSQALFGFPATATAAASFRASGAVWLAAGLLLFLLTIGNPIRERARNA